MRILICYPWLSLGGAPNTSITLARGLKELGHEVFFFTKDDEKYAARLREAGIKMIPAPHHRVLPQLDLLNMKAYRALKSALKEHSIDIVHCFHHNSYILALFAAPRLHIPVLFTAVWFLYTKPFPAYPGRLVFVAEEFKDQATPLFGGHPREILLLPNRIDLDEHRPGIDYTDFSRDKKLPDAACKLAFMSRIDTIKMRSIRNVIEAARILALRNRDVLLALAGDGVLFDEVKRMSDGVNREVGRDVIRLLGAIRETPQFLSWSDIVLGMGRSAVEGMACGKVTLIVGENGFAGVVEPESVHRLQYYNFAGRNVTEMVEPVKLADVIDRISADESERERLSKFARQYAIELYDYKIGAVRLERMYKDALDDPPLTAIERVRLFCTNVVYGYGWRCYIALKMKLRNMLGRDTAKMPPDSPSRPDGVQ
jgi:glycosyltransferase involved in cell wall biosynthesis